MMLMEPWKMGTGEWIVNADETEGFLPGDAGKAFRAAAEDYPLFDLSPVALLGTQVVAGINYMVLCKAGARSADAHRSLKVAIIYRDLFGHSELTHLRDFSLTDLFQTAIVAESEDLSPFPLVGGWSVPGDYRTANLPVEVEDAAADALSDEVGKTYECLYFLGSMECAGTVYAVLTHTEKESAGAIEVTFIWASADDFSILIGSLPLEPADYT